MSIWFYIPDKIGNLFKTVLETSIWMLYICQKDVWTASWFPYFAFRCFHPCSGWVMNQTLFDTPFSQNILWAMDIFLAQPQKLTWQRKNTILHRRYIFQTRCVSIVMFVFGGEKRHLIHQPASLEIVLSRCQPQYPRALVNMAMSQLKCRQSQLETSCDKWVEIIWVLMWQLGICKHKICDYNTTWYFS